MYTYNIYIICIYTVYIYISQLYGCYFMLFPHLYSLIALSAPDVFFPLPDPIFT